MISLDITSLKGNTRLPIVHQPTDCVLDMQFPKDNQQF